MRKIKSASGGLKSALARDPFLNRLCRGFEISMQIWNLEHDLEINLLV
jgi:hypothetical protein